MLMLVDAHHAIMNRAVDSKLILEASQNGLAQANWEDGRHPRHTAIAQDVLSS